MKKVPISQEGASAVEFALILPLLALIVFGTIEFGLLLYNKQVLTNASREGCRAGIVARDTRLTQAEIDGIVQNFCTSRLITFNTVKTPPTTNVIFPASQTFGQDLDVRVAYNYDFLVIPSFITGLSPFTLNARTVMKYE